MSDELKEIELETARIKLNRERMAYEYELRKQNRFEKVFQVASQVTATASDAAEKVKKNWQPFLKSSLKALGLLLFFSFAGVVLYMVFVLKAV